MNKDEWPEIDWVVFDTRDISKYVNVLARNWLEARKKGSRQLKIPMRFTNAGSSNAGMVDHDFVPKTTVRRKQ